MEGSMLTHHDIAEIESLIAAGFVPLQLMELANHRGWFKDDVRRFLESKGFVESDFDYGPMLRGFAVDELHSPISEDSLATIPTYDELAKSLGVLSSQRPNIFSRRKPDLSDD